MTRFARANGSKASNQRIPDESTPWSELKNEVKQQPNNEWSVTDNVEGETNWKEVINNEKKVEENLNSVWCDFSDNEEKTKTSKESKLKTKDKFSASDFDTRKNKKRLKKIKNSDDADNDNRDQESRPFKKVRKNDPFEFEGRLSDSEDKTSHKPEILKSENENKSVVNNPSDWSEGFDWQEPEDKNQDSEFSHQMKHSHFINKTFTTRFSGSRNWSVTGRQYKKFTSDSHMRRKYDQGDVTLDVNGEKIVVTKLDGFYIKKDDAERIKELERDMLKRGIPKEEIRAVVKRERRNAEKSLARQKKKVCFHCRKGGHNLSSCPKLNDGGAQIIGSGICYKCGSTEHSHIQCRVASGQTYKFATCFICKEEGHIAKQCPDNPRGLYPDGGACKLCGDVTHFKKDCPSLPSKNKVTVGTIDRDIETLGDNEDQPKELTHKKKKKVIKFK